MFTHYAVMIKSQISVITNITEYCYYIIIQMFSPSERFAVGTAGVHGPLRRGGWMKTKNKEGPAVRPDRTMGNRVPDAGGMNPVFRPCAYDNIADPRLMPGRYL